MRCVISATHFCHQSGTVLPSRYTALAVSPDGCERVKGDYSLSLHTTALVVNALRTGDGSEGILMILYNREADALKKPPEVSIVRA